MCPVGKARIRRLTGRPPEHRRLCETECCRALRTDYHPCHHPCRCRQRSSPTRPNARGRWPFQSLSIPALPRQIHRGHDQEQTAYHAGCAACTKLGVLAIRKCHFPSITPSLSSSLRTVAKKPAPPRKAERRRTAAYKLRLRATHKRAIAAPRAPLTPIQHRG